MQLRSFQIPQADRIESVVMAAIAIGNGARKDFEIIQNIPGLNDARQGRYYRDALELLEFVVTHRNNSSLTASGQEFLANPTIQNPVLLRAVLNIEVVQRLIPFFELHPGATRGQAESFLYEIVEGGAGNTTVPRRLSTLTSWLEALNILRRENNRFYLENFTNHSVPVLNLTDDSQPLLPTPGELTDFQIISERVSRANDTIIIEKNQAKLDRAVNSHNRLVNLVASRISAAGGIPKSNELVDLAANMGQDFFFEMKSNDGGNTRSQIRKGVSQLQEYRYLQDKKEVKLVLVIQNPLDGSSEWMQDYLENDRDILLVWDGDDLLHASEQTRQHLPFLQLIA